MQTKFSTLLKLKKNELEMVERQVTIIQNKIQSCKEDLSNQNNVIDSLETPKEGSILLLKQFSSHMSILMDEKKRMEEKLLVLQNDYEQTMQIYKPANIEYEKIKHIDELEIKKALHKIKLDEQKQLDEISTMLYEGQE